MVPTMQCPNCKKKIPFPHEKQIICKSCNTPLKIVGNLAWHFSASLFFVILMIVYFGSEFGAEYFWGAAIAFAILSYTAGYKLFIRVEEKEKEDNNKQTM